MWDAKLRLGVCAALIVCGAAHSAHAGTITMSPNPLDVGPVLLGGSGMATGTLSDTENERVDLVLTNSCTGTGTGTFVLSETSNIMLNSPASITVTYTPATRGIRQCTVNVILNGTSTLLGSFFVRGTGQAPATASLTMTAPFAAVRWNDAAPVHTSTQSFTITNTGDQNLDITSVQITGPNAGEFAITSGTQTATILPANSRTWIVTFNPAAAAGRTATIAFNGDDPKTAALAGTGTNAVISVGNLAFGIVNTGSSSSLDAVVSNIGAAPKGNLYVTSAAITGGNGWFALSSCGLASCPVGTFISTTANVGVRCTPPAAAAANDMQTATLSFVSDTDDATLSSMQLSCTAGKSAVATSAPSVVFPGQLVMTSSAPQTIQITNGGNVGATFYFARTGAAAANFAISGPTCGLTGTTNPCTVGPMSSMTFNVTFTPTIEGDYAAGINLAATTAATPPFAQMALAGRGIDRHILVDPALMFPDTYRNPGPDEPPTPVKVNNIGEYPLTVLDLSISGEPVYSLAPGQPTMFQVPPLSSVDVLVRFAPLTAGKASDGQLTVSSDDRTTPGAVIMLSGNGKDRNIELAPSSVDFRDTGAGVPTKMSIVTGGLLSVTNMDMKQFKIRRVWVDSFDSDDNVFEVQDKNGNSISGTDASGVDIDVLQTQEFEIVFSPRYVGEYNGMVNVYLDADDTAQKSVPIHGRALFVDAHGSGGCSTGGGGAGLVIALGALLVRRRKRVA